MALTPGSIGGGLQKTRDATTIEIPYLYKNKIAHN